MILSNLLRLYQIRKNVRKDPRELRELQNGKLRAILKHAYENVPFYHKKFDAAGIKPSDVKNVSDLVKVPITTKAELKAASLEDILAIDTNECGKRSTSGSTGVPLNIYLDRKALIFEGLVLKRTFFENGLKASDRMAVVTDPITNPQEPMGLLQRMGFMDKRQISIFNDIEKQAFELEAYHPDILRGYSSALTALACYYRQKERRLHPRLIFAGAEILNKTEREMISRVFESRLFDFYGCMEFGHMAWECEEHMGYHINVDSMVMEFTRQGENVASGERGEILGTNLYNYAMPFIRYKLNDVGTPLEEPCCCGRSFPLMKIVEGRKDDFLLTSEGKVVSPMLFFPYPFDETTNLRQLRIIQERKDLLKIQLATDDSFDKNSALPNAEKNIHNVFGEDMQVEFDIMDQIPRDPSGKLRKIISRITSEEVYA